VYNQKQLNVIYSLVRGILNASPETMQQFLQQMDDKIATADLSFQQQSPLFIATAVGKAFYEYWMLNIPQPSIWAVYMTNPAIAPTANDAVNYAALSNWVSAAMQVCCLLMALLIYLR